MFARRLKHDFLIRTPNSVFWRLRIIGAHFPWCFEDLLGLQIFLFYLRIALAVVLAVDDEVVARAERLAALHADEGGVGSCSGSGHFTEVNDPDGHSIIG